MNRRIRVQQFAGDLLLGIGIYLLVEFGATQDAQPEEWTTWAKGLGVGVLYRVLPQVLTFLVAMREGRLWPEDVIGDGEGKL